MKYILVTGGVYSGIGKGVVTSSIAKLLQWCGIRVTAIKIDPYINIDAGTFSPFEHGEVFVLDDGSEVDLDLGNYERFLDIKLTKDNNLTTGKIYQSIINRERAGDYLGKTVQTIPHITDAIQEWVERVARIPVTKDARCPEVCVIELGGTIGDIDSKAYLYAFREFALKNRKDFCCVLVTVLHQLKASGEWKTKTTQNSFRDLRFSAFDPDILFCRSEVPFENDIKAKIASSCGIDIANVIGLPDVSPIYRVPCELAKQNIVTFLAARLNLTISDELLAGSLMSWKNLLAKMENNLHKVVRIALVGKYTKLTDSYASLLKAIEHACIAVECTPEVLFIEASHLESSAKLTDPVKYHDSWQKLCMASGIIIPGGFGERGFEGMIEACRWARENHKPFLGICLGFQTAVVEFARSILGRTNANSIEIDPNTSDPVVIEMPEHHTGQMGGTLRLGLRQVQFNRDSILKQLYDKDVFEERHRHRYEANSAYVPDLEAHGLHFVASDVLKGNYSVLELADHPFYIGTQFHPEYLSRPLKPSPVFLGFVMASLDRLATYRQSRSAGNGHEKRDYFIFCDNEISKQFEGVNCT